MKPLFTFRSFVLQLIFWGIHSGSQMNLWVLLLCINLFLGICVRTENDGIIFHRKRVGVQYCIPCICNREDAVCCYM